MASPHHDTQHPHPSVAPVPPQPTQSHDMPPLFDIFLAPWEGFPALSSLREMIPAGRSRVTTSLREN